MKTNLRKMAFAVMLAAAVPLFLPSVVSAQMREFSGKIDKINKKKLIVDNRQGDKVSFDRTPETVVEGEKDSYDKLKKEDWVKVSWKFIDKPRKAYKIVVSPPQEEEGEDAN